MKENKIWSIILAGGEGERVSPLVKKWLGFHKPKQYCTFVGSRSMLQHTLDRADQLIAPQRRVMVIARGHRGEMGSQLRGRTRGMIIEQPANRNTAAGVFLPLAMVRSREPEATAVIYPSDHFVYPEDRFVALVRSATRAARLFPDRLILLGAVPQASETEYGWIIPAGQIGTVDDSRLLSVREFREKPPAAEAAEIRNAGGLWSTMIIAGRVNLFWEAGWRCFPEVMWRLEILSRYIGTPSQETVKEQLYRSMPSKNFSADLLGRVAGTTAVLEMSGLIWSDWGQPQRIAQTLARVGKQPAFPADCLGAV
jgi:mannose-1-phosphate guanylyltransferase